MHLIPGLPLFEAQEFMWYATCILSRRSVRYGECRAPT